MGYSDILAHLIESQDEETGTAYSENELVGEGILILIAGQWLQLLVRIATNARETRIWIAASGARSRLTFAS